MDSIEILVVEDSPSDAKLMMKMLELAKLKNNVHLVRDGQQALDFLAHAEPYQQAPRPDLIFLDLNLPKKSGFEVLKVIKNTPELRVIPVVIMSTSEDEQDILQSYANYASCYVTKPVDFAQFQHVIQTIDSFWFTVVKLPPHHSL
jgi:CheY-like chemotaxis protein